jgi:hypothetical protein
VTPPDEHDERDGTGGPGREDTMSEYDPGAAPTPPAPPAAPGANAGPGTASGTETGPGPETGTETRSAVPVPPPDIIEAARHAPDHWFSFVDPAWTDEGEPPAWATVGRWRSDATGAIVAWERNPEYRPSPAALRWPDPTDPVDAAVQRAATGYGPADDVPRALAAAELAVLVRPDGGLVAAGSEDGAPVVPAYTARAHLATAGRLAFEVVPVAELLDRLPEGHELYLNPAGPVAMRIAGPPLRAAVAARRATVPAPGAGDGP